MMLTKSTAKSTILIPQPHGGALASGGTIGNRGGPGRTPSALRAQLRGEFAQRIPVVTAIADDPEAPRADRLRAMDLLARYGIGQASDLSVDQVRERLTATLALLRQRLPADEAEPIIADLRPIWLE